MSLALLTLLGQWRHASNLVVLQMNLCNSGWAGCYTGRSLAEAASVIRARDPDVVTLNEICRGDVNSLVGTLGARRIAAFQPSIDRRTGEPVRCRDGEPYGIGLLSRPPEARTVAGGGIYPTQDPSSPEARAWLCAPASRGGSVCTTHLANANPLIALAQCRHLLTTVVSSLQGPVVVAGDFNLVDLRTCLPPGYASDSDGSVQFVVAAATTGLREPRLVGMAETTDHPALLVTLGHL
jgi:hypothetical protein